MLVIRFLSPRRKLAGFTSDTEDRYLQGEKQKTNQVYCRPVSGSKSIRYGFDIARTVHCKMSNHNSSYKYVIIVPRYS
jgi:hypothetical protein